MQLSSRVPLSNRHGPSFLGALPLCALRVPPFFTESWWCSPQQFYEHENDHRVSCSAVLRVLILFFMCFCVDSAHEGTTHGALRGFAFRRTFRGSLTRNHLTTRKFEHIYIFTQNRSAQIAYAHKSDIRMALLIKAPAAYWAVCSKTHTHTIKLTNSEQKRKTIQTTYTSIHLMLVAWN